MKKRLGFVSNSSSSSFVVLGYSFDSDFLEDINEEESIYDILEEYSEDFTILNGSEDGIPDGKVVCPFYELLQHTPTMFLL